MNNLIGYFALVELLIVFFGFLFSIGWITSKQFSWYIVLWFISWPILIIKFLISGLIYGFNKTIRGK